MNTTNAVLAIASPVRPKNRLHRGDAKEPLGYVDGMSLYQYCCANPANLTDPKGLCGGTAPDANETGKGVGDDNAEIAALYDPSWEEWSDFGEEPELKTGWQTAPSACPTPAEQSIVLADSYGQSLLIQGQRGTVWGPGINNPETIFSDLGGLPWMGILGGSSPNAKKEGLGDKALKVGVAAADLLANQYDAATTDASDSGLTCAKAVVAEPLAMTVPVAAIGTTIAELVLSAYAPFTEKYAVGDCYRTVYMGYKGVFVKPTREDQLWCGEDGRRQLERERIQKMKEVDAVTGATPLAPSQKGVQP